MLTITSVRPLLYAAALCSALTACSPPTAPLQEFPMLAVAGAVLYSIDLRGDDDVPIITLTAPATLTDVARDPRTGDVYVVSSDRLYRADLRTGGVSAVGGRNMNALNALASDARGHLFAGDEYGGLYRLDPALGVAFPLSETHGPEPLSGDLAAAPDGTLYATMVAGSSDRLVTVDPVTGAVQSVGLTGVDDIYGLSFRSGTLYGMTAGGDLLALDQRTGHARLVRSTGIRNVYGLD